MKDTIDNLISSIRADLEQPPSSIPELNAFREMSGLDGLARTKMKGIFFTGGPKSTP
jgi:hypothetical protein